MVRFLCLLQLRSLLRTHTPYARGCRTHLPHCSPRSHYRLLCQFPSPTILLTCDAAVLLVVVTRNIWLLLLVVDGSALHLYFTTAIVVPLLRFIAVTHTAARTAVPVYTFLYAVRFTFPAPPPRAGICISTSTTTTIPVARRTRSHTPHLTFPAFTRYLRFPLRGFFAPPIISFRLYTPYIRYARRIACDTYAARSHCYIPPLLQLRMTYPVPQLYDVRWFHYYLPVTCHFATLYLRVMLRIYLCTLRDVTLSPYGSVHYRWLRALLPARGATYYAPTFTTRI